ncbi:pentatricopeptide repeat-containing protein At3g53360, mitochondrial-like isoform X2 [Dendrobium catenatum]|uniref:pentatricopeptide repeat-containing protein At3g53360, mitochondrial-like isoform X2 n=1 Tax=Dendrobium catenatum TaxID=906689 RepID=UPI0009F4242B|nr:pentatricopeptide repeat-containing protein At3g53360, mitochondrial-like isoform X2 [Dendrobium catenatum]
MGGFTAQKVFDEILQPNLVSWSSLISGHCQFGEHEEALRIFSRARRQGVMINEFVLASVLSACSGLEELKVAKQLHCISLKNGLFFDSFVEAATIGMYVNSGDLESAYLAFSDIKEPGLASWAVIIRGFALEGYGEKAMCLFRKLNSTGLRPNEHVLPSILVGCSMSHIVEGGMQIHSLLIKLGYQMFSCVGNTILDFYAKCGMFRESLLVFEAMEERDVVSWNAIFAAYIRHGDLIGASKLLNEMLLQCKDLNVCTYSSILSLCADLPAIEWGLATHCCVLKLDFDANVVVGSSLIDMYAKCGWLNYALRIFNRMPSENLVSWNSMIFGYAQHGFGMEAVEMFHRMEAEGIVSNEITFIGILSACARVGLVEQGEIIFKLMKTKGIIPRIEHYASMVDLFARAGETKRAYNFVKNMPMEPNTVIWRCLLAGCKSHGDLNIGMLAAKYILNDEPHDISARAMASALYVSAGLWDERAKVRGTPKREAEKVPGRSWIEVKGRFPHAVNGLLT